MKWKKVKLTEISKPKQWKNLPISELSSEGYPVYGANGIIGRYKEYNHEFPTLAITCRGATCGTINITEPKSYITSNAMALDDICEDVDQKFLYYALNKRGFKDVITGAAQPQITREGLSKIVLDIPESKEYQLHIASLLSKAENLISKRKESIRLLDDFLKSTFLEMFGDSVKNEKKWNKSELKNYAKVRIGPFGSLLHREDYVQNGIPLVNPSHIGEGKIAIDPELTISKSKMKELSAYVMHEGDVVLGRRGEIGRCAVVTKKEDGYLCGTGSIFIRPTAELSPIFLYNTISSASMRKVLENSAKGITMKNLNSGIIEKLKIPVPPIELQTQFAQIVEKTEAIKTQYQQSLQELENLYGSLSQRAFKGELNLKDEGLLSSAELGRSMAAEPETKYGE